MVVQPPPQGPRLWCCTAASLMVGAGVLRLVVQKILNHVETGVTAVYHRQSYDQEKRSAVLRGERLEAVINKQAPSALTFAGPVDALPTATAGKVTYMEARNRSAPERSVPGRRVCPSGSWSCIV